jgi:hypothetical protein
MCITPRIDIKVKMIMFQLGLSNLQKEGGYVKSETKFMVTNQLVIFASLSMTALIALEMIRSERVGDLDTMEILVNVEEVRQKLYCKCQSIFFMHNHLQYSTWI